MVSFTSSIRRITVVFRAQFKFSVKLICCIAFGSACSTFYYLNLLLSSYNNF